MPLKHETQPDARIRSGGRAERDPEVLVCLNKMRQDYEACKYLIKDQRNLAQSEEAREWLRIIRKRLEWLVEDQKYLEDLLEYCKPHNISVPDRSAIEEAEAQSGKLRDLYSRAIRKVAKDQSLIHKEYKSRVSYDNKIKNTLRDCYDDVSKSIDELAKEINGKLLAAKAERKKSYISVKVVRVKKA